MQSAEHIDFATTRAGYGIFRYRKSDDRNAQAGFTLLELLIVLVLVTLMMGLSAVLFGNFLSSGRLNAAAREVSATIRYARSLARIDGEKQTVLIDLDSRQYGIEGGRTRALPKDVHVMIEDPFSGQMRTGEYRITFQPYAGAEGGTIVLWNSRKSISILLDPVVGTVAVK